MDSRTEDQNDFDADQAELLERDAPVTVHAGQYTMEDYRDDYGDTYVGPTYFEPDDDPEFGTWDGYGE